MSAWEHCSTWVYGSPPSKALRLRPSLLAACRSPGERSGARITLAEDVETVVCHADFPHTGVWGSMGEPAGAWRERIELLLRYQVNGKAIAATGNPDVKVVHCLPALHDRHIRLDREPLDACGPVGLEIADEVSFSPASFVFDQAENRPHTIKAVLVAGPED
ncbi:MULTISPECIES: hypothetical protein [unclassified Streptomyces]|uniref:hypothetical protein n=1 Tax=unclassified Streptomyces TaxID=2593676 RepID=UPI002DDB55F6|nr:hypothetical protein [Streptomyces sp. NBC_00243]WRZ18003.1 hypothetical protein OHT59_05650 [Streptomyces sp. NBC_00243]